MSESVSILVVEDDDTLREGLCDALEGQGYVVYSAADGFEAQTMLARGAWGLVVLDLMLPGPGGLELLREYRTTEPDTPVLILTARGEETDKVLGLELGADDYVTKPYGLRELLARIKAHLRRSERAQDRETPATFTLGACKVDLRAFQVQRGGIAARLSPKEAAILDLLHRQTGRAVPREELLREVWGSGAHVTNRTVDTHVLNLRQKIESDPKSPRYLLTVHGVGYRLQITDPTSS